MFGSIKNNLCIPVTPFHSTKISMLGLGSKISITFSRFCQHVEIKVQSISIVLRFISASCLINFFTLFMLPLSIAYIYASCIFRNLIKNRLEPHFL